MTTELCLVIEHSGRWVRIKSAICRATFSHQSSCTLNNGFKMVDKCQGLCYGGIMSDPVRARYFSEDRGSDMRFAAPGRCKTFRVATLWDSHREICRRLALGEKASEIARDLGVSQAMISYTKNSKAAQDQIGILRGAMDADTIDLGRQIQEFAPKALKLLEEIIEGKGEGRDASIGLRARYADRHLDRAGYSPVKKVQSVTTHLTRQDIEAIKERARKSALEAGVIDAEVVDVREE